MNSSKDKSSLRYFMASLKPLGTPLFWAPLGLISLMFIGWWQYQQHPEWLGAVGEQPAQSIDGVPINITEDNSQTPTTEQPNNKDSDLIQGYDPTQILTFSNDPKKKTRSTQNNNTNTNPTTPTGNSENKSSLFAPLMPTIKPNTQNFNPNQSTLNPIQVESPLTRDYPLRKAIESIPSSQPTYNNYPRSTSNSYSNNSNQGGYNNNQIPTNNTTQQPYSNNYGQDNTTNQPYQSPYSNNNYYRQNNSVPSSQSPYSNNYNQPNNSVPQTQSNPYNSSNNNNAGYQVQPRINGEAGY